MAAGGGVGYGARDPLSIPSNKEDNKEEEGGNGSDGGAYPEVRRWQYPLGMGKNGEGKYLNELYKEKRERRRRRRRVTLHVTTRMMQ